MRSLITVQLGGYANYVGAHFWNMQVRTSCATSALRSLRAEPRLLQDEAAGLAEAHDGAASPFAELDADVLYRCGGTAQARRS
jgi:hypothetical protein